MRILFCRRFARGDVLLAHRVVEEYHNKYPDHELYFLTYPKAVEIIKVSPFIKQLIADGVAPVEESKLKDLDFRSQFDKIYNLDGVYEQHGYRKSYMQCFFDKVGLEYDNTISHIPMYPQWYFSELGGFENKYLTRYNYKLPTDKFIISIDPFCFWPSRSADYDNWLTDFCDLTKQYNWQIVLCGGLDIKGGRLEKECYTPFEIPQSVIDQRFNSYFDMAQIFSVSDVVVTADSFALHLAISVLKGDKYRPYWPADSASYNNWLNEVPRFKLLALFGATDHKVVLDYLGPDTSDVQIMRYSNCDPCYQTNCKETENFCKDFINPQDLVESIYVVQRGG